MNFLSICRLNSEKINCINTVCSAGKLYKAPSEPVNIYTYEPIISESEINSLNETPMEDLFPFLKQQEEKQYLRNEPTIDPFSHCMDEDEVDVTREKRCFFIHQAVNLPR